MAPEEVPSVNNDHNLSVGMEIIEVDANVEIIEVPSPDNDLVVQGRPDDCAARIGLHIPDQFELGPMECLCLHCYARHFAKEQISGHFSLCCGNGKILLTGNRILKPVPPILRQLLNKDNVEAHHFQSRHNAFHASIHPWSVIRRFSPCSECRICQSKNFSIC